MLPDKTQGQSADVKFSVILCLAETLSITLLTCEVIHGAEPQAKLPHLLRALLLATADPGTDDSRPVLLGEPGVVVDIQSRALQQQQH